MIKAPYQLPLLLVGVAVVFTALIALIGFGVWTYLDQPTRWPPGEDEAPVADGSAPAENPALTTDPTPTAPPNPAPPAKVPSTGSPVRAAGEAPPPTPKPSSPPPPPRRRDPTKIPDPATATLELSQRALTVPVLGIARNDLRDTYPDSRSGGRVHEAIDIMASRGTPVRAVEDGRVIKLFDSVPGGLTVYQFDPTETYCYYYAHLQRYAPSLEEGDEVRRGEVLGFVGSTGNAAEDAPHLHFAIYILPPEKHWWEGEPINPYPILRQAIGEAN